MFRILSMEYKKYIPRLSFIEEINATYDPSNTSEWNYQMITNYKPAKNGSERVKSYIYPLSGQQTFLSSSILKIQKLKPIAANLDCKFFDKKVSPSHYKRFYLNLENQNARFGTINGSSLYLYYSSYYRYFKVDKSL